MKRILFLFAIIGLSVLDGHAQRHYDAILQQVEQHNPLLQAARQQAEAARLQTHVGLLIPNPEVEVATFKGFPSDRGNRIDFSVSQTFELPSVLVRRARLRRLEEQAADLDYLTVRNALLRSAQEICADWLYYHSVQEVYDRRCQSAVRLATLYQKRMDEGDCSLLEYNRVQMNLSEMTTQRNSAALLLGQTSAELATLTGSSQPSTIDDYPVCALPLSFERWYDSVEAASPELRSRTLLVDTRRQELQLSRSLWLPELSVGYTSETVTGEAFRGVSVGVTLPIWSQQRAVSHANLSLSAAQQELDAHRLTLRSRMQALYSRVVALQHNLAELRASFDHCNSQSLLDRALAAGEITLEDYLVQVDYYTTQELQICQLAHDLEQAYIQLFAFTL